jgi:prepilin-type N-terminal cleavage/methylation domain-containing protein
VSPTERRRGDSGFTLLEMVIAMLVMSVAVVALMSGLASMLQLSGEHRGHAVLETSAHSFSQAVMASGQATTTLTSGVLTTAGSLSVADASLFKVGFDIAVDLETMRVTSVGAGFLGVTRAVNAGDVARSHSSGARVSRLLRCPSATDMTPPTGSYGTTAGVADPTVAEVRYWDGSAFQLTSDGACLSTYNAVCQGDILAECSGGLFQVKIDVTTSGDGRLRGLGTSTYVLVRKGGA